MRRRRFKRRGKRNGKQRGGSWLMWGLVEGTKNAMRKTGLGKKIKNGVRVGIQSQIKNKQKGGFITNALNEINKASGSKFRFKSPGI